MIGYIVLDATTHFDNLIIDLLCSAPATFESQFQIELPLLYKYLIDAPSGKVFLYFYYILMFSVWKDAVSSVFVYFPSYY